MNFKYIVNSKVLNDRWLEEVNQELENINAMQLLNKQREKAKKHYQTKMDFETGLNENYVVAFRE